MQEIRQTDLPTVAALAFLGDAVHSLRVREMLVRRGYVRAGEINRAALSYVTAAAQAAQLARVLPLFDEDETAVFHRARNSKHVNVPKSASVSDYRAATGLEAVFGMLYYLGRTARIDELFARMTEEQDQTTGAKTMIQKIKGTMDILPEEANTFRWLENIMREEAARYGYGEIRTPTIEWTDLFVRGVGDTTDVVQKEMYTFADRDEEKTISLRPEGTASVVRALIENGECGDTMPKKYYYLINCFRHEKPQAGRSREFFQFGSEMFGAVTPASDATAIALAASVLRRIGLKNIRLHLNSIGCRACRPDYRAALVSHFSQHTGCLCDTCKDRLNKNPLRLLDCKNPECAAVAKQAPRTVDHLCPDCAAHFKTLCETLDRMGIEYVVDPSIVRGLDYYTRTVFEFVAEGIGAQSTVCGGGRYDGLVSSLGGPDLPGIGFGMGITRVILAMQQEGISAPAPEAPTLYIAALGERAATEAMAITERLRREGKFAECDVVGRSLKAQMKYANKLNAAYTLIIGDAEVESGRAEIRDMRDGTQRTVELATFTI